MKERGGSGGRQLQAYEIQKKKQKKTLKCQMQVKVSKRPESANAWLCSLLLKDHTDKKNLRPIDY